MVLLLAALITTSAPLVLESRSATLLPLAATATAAEPPRPEFSLGLKLSAPVIGLFAEMVGGIIAVQTISGPLSAAVILPQRTQQILVLPLGVISSLVFAGASAVAIHGWLGRPDINVPMKTLWWCGSGTFAIAATVGIIVGFITGAPIIGMLYGMGVGAVAAPIVQTIVATRASTFRTPPPGPTLSFRF